MKRAVFVGQAMPRNKKDPHDWQGLNSWLHSINVTDSAITKHLYYSALVNYFPGTKNGSHRVPAKEEISKESLRLKKLLLGFNPEIIVPVGRLSISYCLGIKFGNLKDVLGKVYKVNPYGFFHSEKIIIPLPHPSGASTWRHRKENQLILANSLQLLKNHLFS